MRASTGSAWIFSICLMFIILFTAYLAISVNYAKAFRIKNNIVDKIEENEGYNANLEEGFEDYLYNEGYNAYGVCDPFVSIEGKDEDWALDECLRYGSAPSDRCSVCIYRSLADNKKGSINGANRSYYRVVTFFKFDIPVVRALLPAFQVAGESRYIYDFANAGQ